MVAISAMKAVSRRLTILRRTVIVDTQKIREKAITQLEELFELAVKIAKGEVKTQMVDEKRVKVTLKHRQAWARVAAYIAQIMNSVAEGFDERELDENLEELERLIDEAKAKSKAAKDQKPAQGGDNASG